MEKFQINYFFTKTIQEIKARIQEIKIPFLLEICENVSLIYNNFFQLFVLNIFIKIIYIYFSF